MHRKSRRSTPAETDRCDTFTLTNDQMDLMNTSGDDTCDDRRSSQGVAIQTRETTPPSLDGIQGPSSHAGVTNGTNDRAPRQGSPVLPGEETIVKRAVAAAGIAAGLMVASAGMASAAGMSDTAQIHPGHQGYIESGMKGGGVPAAHFHGGVPYPTGPGGWGATVSMTAKTSKGIPHAHP